MLLTGFLVEIFHAHDILLILPCNEVNVYLLCSQLLQSNDFLVTSISKTISSESNSPPPRPPSFALDTSKSICRKKDVIAI